MRILSIETSCDETAVSVVSVGGKFPHATYAVAGNGLYSQSDIHAEFGGVYPTVAKREHAKALVPMMYKALEEAELVSEEPSELSKAQMGELAEIIIREPELYTQLTQWVERFARPDIDVIAVTTGPGLAPALWVGVNFAKALAKVWDIPVVPVNHMEGHVLASIFDVDQDDMLSDITFPALSLLISGGHTELVLMQKWGQYEKIGQTRDDAVGEAFDKVARLMGLPYPGGPQISKLAQKARVKELPPYKDDLPRPMLNSGDLDFSFSGLKTSVRYALEGKELSETEQMALARDFEDCVAETLIGKTKQALEQTGAQTLIVGGGVSANQYLRTQFELELTTEYPELTVYFPMPGLSTDNSVMIALAGHAKLDGKLAPQAAVELLKADGNKSLS
ncbi:tRNA (adenosine(37)-N6)-threonylcarbamoyltransferase complex transferase subunit TsaD [bacterium]|nr:tRNA (adenosine(37)-N6)-threonylcarbamoyltransferase complex transferase subunit TsaD [bacterium]|tara:strand:- start:929 stop:2107 length:1179 start_codon:yes stop_codon:yes gene_type:complete